MFAGDNFLNQAIYQATKIHIRDKRKRYGCDVGEKGISVSSVLLMHKNTHIKEINLECDVCKKEILQEMSSTGQEISYIYCVIIVQGNYTSSRIARAFSGTMPMQRKVLELHEIGSAYSYRHGADNTHYRTCCFKELESMKPTGSGYICFVCMCQVTFGSSGGKIESSVRRKNSWELCYCISADQTPISYQKSFLWSAKIVFIVNYHAITSITRLSKIFPY